MNYKTGLLINLKSSWVLAKKRSEEYPEGHPDRDMNSWYAEDIHRFIDIINVSDYEDVNIKYDLAFLRDETPFDSLKNDILMFEKYIEHKKAIKEKNRRYNTV